MDSKGAADRTSDECLGKLRALNNQRDRYILYDNGETSEGRSFVYLGSPSGLGATAAWTAESNQ